MSPLYCTIGASTPVLRHDETGRHAPATGKPVYPATKVLLFYETHKYLFKKVPLFFPHRGRADTSRRWHCPETAKKRPAARGDVG